MLGLQLLLLFTVIGSASRSMASEQITILLKERATVSTSAVFLGDIADISGAEELRLDRLVKLPIASAPQPGTIMNLDQGAVRQQVSEILGTSAEFRISGAATVQIKSLGKPVETSDLAPLLRAHIIETTPWRESEIEILSISRLKGIEIPLSGVLRIPKKTALSGSRGVLIPVEVIFEGKPFITFWINCELRIRARVLQAARRIPYGKTVTQEDVEEAVADIADVRVDCLRKTEEVVGRVARRTLSPGDPITRESLANPFLVRSGDTVRLRLERDGIRLAVLARAEQDGKLGQSIRIRNLDFSKALKARVVGPGEVRVE